MSALAVLRRRQVPVAPVPPVRTGPVCHCSPINHAVGDARAAVGAELLTARLHGQLDLVAALKMRLDACPTEGPAREGRWTA